MKKANGVSGSPTLLNYVCQTTTLRVARDVIIHVYDGVLNDRTFFKHK